MLKRLRNVKFSIYDPEKKKWIQKNDTTVLITEHFIYVVESEPFYHAVVEKFESNDENKNLEDKKKRTAKFDEFFNLMLDECIISKDLQGKIYSGNILWKVELEENPFTNNFSGDTEG